MTVKPVTAVSVMSNSALQFVQRKSRVLWFTFQKDRGTERRFRNDDTYFIHKVYVYLNFLFSLILYWYSLFYRLNLVYLTFILHGIGTLMPWNMFITAKDVSFHRNCCGYFLFIRLFFL